MDFIAKDRLVPLNTRPIPFRPNPNVDEARTGPRPGRIRCTLDPDDEASGGRFALDFATFTIDVEAKSHCHLPRAAPADPPPPTSRPGAARAGTSSPGPTDRSRRGLRRLRRRVPPMGRDSEGGPRSASPRPSSSTGPLGRTLAAG